MKAKEKYRGTNPDRKMIGLSISYQRENLLARGLGQEHLRELLLRLARPLIRQRFGIAYGGNWEADSTGLINFTLELLRLINAEMEDSSPDDDSGLSMGRLYNYSAWPDFLKIPTIDEARWINCCTVIRVTQQVAGIAAADVIPDGQAGSDSDQVLLNSAVTLSAMRRLAMAGIVITVPGGLKQFETLPPVLARIVLGGKLEGYRGFLSGIFEEALLTLEQSRPLYLLGGFGGACEALARAMLASGSDRPDELTPDWHRKRNPKLDKILKLIEATPGAVAAVGENSRLRIPAGIRPTGPALDALFEIVLKARTDLPGILNNGLDMTENRELLETRDMPRVVQLVRKGLGAKLKLDLSKPA